MGWFDKKSWQLRRKIRDLQAELAEAEREGKYVVEQGLFFAELEEMGDQTLMVLGTADHLDSEEEAIIRNFFERNGFTVEEMRLDKSQKTLASVEIIPPQELTRRVAMQLKDAGYRLVDDSDQERPSRPAEMHLTLSGLVRSISALFAAHVHQLIVSTPIKMNMEGNRLLHWMPLVRDFLAPKAGTEIISICREPFVHAYNHYYGQLGRMENTDLLADFPDNDAHVTDILESDLPENRQTWDETAPTDATAAEAAASDGSTTNDFTANRRGQMDKPAALRETEAAFVLASIYKSLIGASKSRRVRNAEVVLDHIARFFAAKSACLLSRPARTGSFSIQSNSPGPQCIQVNGEGAVCTDLNLLEEAITGKTVVVVPGGGNGSHHPQAVIAPLPIQEASDAVIYLANPQEFHNGNPSPDSENLKVLARVFTEFPDLLIADFIEKSETASAE